MGIGVALKRPDGRRLRAELAPSSEYDAACTASVDRDAWLWTVVHGQRVLLWEIEGAGVVDVGVDRGRGEIVLLRTWVNDQRGERAARQYIAHDVSEQAIGEELRIASGALVVAWSAVAFADLERVRDAKALMASATKAKLEAVSLSNGAIDGLGAVLQVEPGHYHVFTGNCEQDQWIARWCRLRRASAG